MPFINIYHIDLAYGGPEEGGWYYQTGSIEKTIAATSYQQAERGLRLVTRIVAARNAGLPEISSVLSRGRYQALIERRPGADYPSIRPHYA